MSKTFLTFGNQRFKKSRERIIEEAKKVKYNNTDFFDNFVMETENIEKEEGFKKIIDQIPEKWRPGRGYYWYMWKPYVIYKNLKKLKDGDILFYCDSGMKINTSNITINRFNELVNIVTNKDKCPTGVVTFITTGSPKDRFEYMYNTVYVFEHFNVLNDTNITHTQQNQAGVNMIYKTDKSMEIIEKWYNYAVTNPELFVGDLRVFPKTKRTQMNGFRDHRQDQSIWSVHAKLNNVTILNHNKNPIMQTHYRE